MQLAAGEHDQEKRKPTLLRAMLGLTVLAAVIIASSEPHAQTVPPAPDPAASAATQQLRSNKQRLEEAQRRAALLQSDVAAIGDERAQINSRLQQTARDVQTSESQLSAIEQKIEELEQQHTMLQGSLISRHGEITKLLAAMQRMGRNPPPVIVTKREDALQMVRSAMLLSKAFPHLRGQAEHLIGSLTELSRVISESKVARDKLTEETTRYRDSQLRLASLMEVKRQSLTERQQELDQVKRMAQDISRNVTDLTELIGKLDKAIAERTTLGAYEKEAAAAVPPAATPPAPVAGPPTAVPAPLPPAPPAAKDAQVAIAVPAKPAAKPPGAAIELAPSGAAFTGNPGRIKPAIPFQLAKGQLPMPAQGKRVLGFGDKTQYNTVSKGIVIETRHSAQVTSPCDGWIVYAGPFRNYGEILIINAGGGYHVMLLGLGRIDVQLGQFVLASEPVGTTRALPKNKSKDTPPLLFVEFRKDGQSINPDPWWAEASQKVQG